jgi:hypothetical protein
MTTPKKPEAEKKQKLTLKQKRLVEALPNSNSVAEAGETAGYYDRPTAHRALKSISERAPEVLERLGLTIEHVANNCLRPLLEAKETKFFADKGIVLTTKEVEASDIRIRAIEVWARLMGAYTAQKLQLSGDLTLDLNHVSNDELDRTSGERAAPLRWGRRILAVQVCEDSRRARLFHCGQALPRQSVHSRARSLLARKPNEHRREVSPDDV